MVENGSSFALYADLILLSKTIIDLLMMYKNINKGTITRNSAIMISFFQRCRWFTHGCIFLNGGIFSIIGKLSIKF